MRLSVEVVMQDLQRNPKKYELHTADRDDFNEGWIWVRDEESKKDFDGRRRVMKVLYNNKSLYCEVLHIDDFSFDRFNKHSKHQLPAQDDLFLISAWYRRLLDIKERPGEQISVTITEPDSRLGDRI